MNAPPFDEDRIMMPRTHTPADRQTQARPRPSPQAVATRRRIIAHKYRVAALDRQGGQPYRLKGNLRIRELERFFRLKYGRHLSDDDAGRDDLMILFHHFAVAGSDVINRCCHFAKVWAPWLSEAKAEAMAKQAATRPRRYNAAALGIAIGLTDDVRTALKIKTIWAFNAGETAEERRKRKDRERKRDQRAAQPKRVPLSQSRPWEAEGICRRTLERRRKKAATAGLSPPVAKCVHSNLVVLTVDNICDTRPQNHRKRPSKGYSASTRYPEPDHRSPGDEESTARVA
ncbi:hypothetical protein [Bradyrhizobium sp. LMTR 3]|uniref:hypothetical protein n=1 Tax=Bradyrhizobium sp. LMTR 3 TaxID=189873 RepID=UPI0011468A4B|nr:hypothetical protein [Bradyrhizobium sp. LMTR 3]